MRKTFARVLGALLLAALSAAALWPQAASAEGVLRIARHQDSTTLDPIMTIQNADIWVMNNMNGLLVRVNREATDVEPDLAERWEISDDGTVYTFHLREGLKFSDGSPLTAKDAKFSLERLRDQEGSVMASMFSIVKSIETPDDRTVVITLNQPSAPFLASLAMFSAAVLPEKAVTAAGEEFGNNPVGAGAFMLEEWRRGEVIRLKKNPNYWEAGRVKLDGVEWYFIPNDNTRVLKLQAGEVDAIVFIPFNRVNELSGNPDLQVHLDPSTREDHILINHAHKPLDDVRVRQALLHAVDRKAILDNIMEGSAGPARGVLAPGVFGYKDMQLDKLYPFDRAKARALLAQAGWKPGADGIMAKGAQRLSLSWLAARGRYPKDGEITEAIQAMFKEVGVEARVQLLEWAAVFQQVRANPLNHHMFTLGWVTSNADADYSLFALFHSKQVPPTGWNTSRYANARIDTLVEQARRSLNQTEREKLYGEVQDILAREMVWIPVYTTKEIIASRASVKGFAVHPVEYNLALWKTWLDR